MADDDVAPTQLNGRRGKVRISVEDTALILELHNSGVTITDIAKVLSKKRGLTIYPSLVGKWLARARMPNELLRQALSTHRHEAIGHWVTAMKKGAQFGKHSPAKDLLAATGVIADDASPRVQVYVGDGSVAIGKLPTIQIHPPALPDIDQK